MSGLRRLKREVAHNRMRALGYVHINKKRSYGESGYHSPFSKNWRQVISQKVG